MGVHPFITPSFTSSIKLAWQYTAIDHPIISSLTTALEARAGLIDAQHEGALRLFNGFYEGDPHLVVDLYARTLVIFNHAEPHETGEAAAQTAQEFFLSHLPWVEAVVTKPAMQTIWVPGTGRWSTAKSLTAACENTAPGMR